MGPINVIKESTQECGGCGYRDLPNEKLPLESFK
jgi:hypothetical protein